VLYLSGEEKAGTTVRMRLDRLGLSEAEIYFPDKVPTFEEIKEASARFKIIIADSVQSLHLTFKQSQELLELWQDKAVILISQVNNRGKNPLLNLEHLTDIKILLRKGGEAEIGSRYKSTSEKLNWFNIKIFKQS
jgi:predicted ATP-dependent serine protease